MDLKEFTQENADALRRAIGEKLTCPMCGRKNFVVVGGYIRNDLQTRLDSFVIGSGVAMSMAPVVCQHCGFVSLHDLKVLSRIKPNGGDDASK